MSAKRRGTEFEREVINKWMEQDPENHLAIRAAGSANKGKVKVDLVLINLKDKQMAFVQCKATRRIMGARAKQTLLEPLMALQGVFSCRVEVVQKFDDSH